MSRNYRVGSQVERHIDGIWYNAEVIAVTGEDSLTLRYVDDEKVEVDVGVDDVRPLESIFNFIASSSSSSSTLPKPLKGLIDDDSDARMLRIPTVIIHDDKCELENAVVINGPKDNLAVGGGLKALRYLKPS